MNSEKSNSAVGQRESDSTKQKSAYKIQLSAQATPGELHVDGLTQESADRISELLMLNHAKHHTLFNDVGLHNHIVHHLLSLYALGASPVQIQSSYELNKGYQLPSMTHSSDISAKLQDPEFFTQKLGNSEWYKDYLKFFQDEIAAKGVSAVVNEYIFKGDERADDMLGRMYSGFEHPILHLGFGLEFEQPCIVAEALAAAAIHDNWPLPILLPAEELARSSPPSPNAKILPIINDLHSDPVVSTAVLASDPPNKITAGLVKRALQELIPHLAKYTASAASSPLELKTAEMMHTCVYLSACAQHPKKVEMIDFFMMHSTNLSVFYPTFMKQDWISDANKRRLLEWKVRMDLVMYAGCRTPALYPERVTRYNPKKPGSWEGILERTREYLDDGHTSKFIRAVMKAESVSRPYLGQEGFPLGKEAFLKIAHLTLDSVERMVEPEYRLPEMARKMYIEGAGLDEEVVRIIVRWVRWCGLEEAWEEVPNLNEGPRL